MRSIGLAAVVGLLAVLSAPSASGMPRHIIILCDQSGSMDDRAYGAIDTRAERVKVYRDDVLGVLQRAGPFSPLYRPTTDTVSIRLFTVVKGGSLRNNYARMWKTFDANRPLTSNDLNRLAEVPYYRSVDNYSLVYCAKELGLAVSGISDGLFGETFVILITDGQPTDDRNELASVAHCVAGEKWATRVRNTFAERFNFKCICTVRSAGRVSLCVYQVLPIQPPGPLRAEPMQLVRSAVGGRMGTLRLPEAPQQDGYKLVSREWRLEAADTGEALVSGVVQSTDAAEVPVALAADQAGRLTLKPHRVRLTYRYRVTDGYYNCLVWDLSETADATLSVVRIWGLVPVPFVIVSERVTWWLANSIFTLAALSLLVWLGYRTLVMPPAPKLVGKVINTTQAVVSRQFGISPNPAFVLVADLVITDQATPRPFGGSRSASVQVELDGDQYGRLIVPEGHVFSFAAELVQKTHLKRTCEQDVTGRDTIPIYLHVAGIEDAEFQTPTTVNLSAQLKCHVGNSGAVQYHTVSVQVAIEPAEPCLDCKVEPNPCTIEHRTPEAVHCAYLTVWNRGPRRSDGSTPVFCVKPLNAVLRAVPCTQAGMVDHQQSPFVLTIGGERPGTDLNIENLSPTSTNGGTDAVDGRVTCELMLDCSVFPNPGAPTQVPYRLVHRRGQDWVPVSAHSLPAGPLSVTVMPDGRRAQPGDLRLRSPAAAPDAPCLTARWARSPDDLTSDLAVRVRDVRVPEPGVASQTLAIFTLSNTAKVNDGEVSFAVSELDVTWTNGTAPTLKAGRTLFRMNGLTLAPGDPGVKVKNGDNPTEIALELNSAGIGTFAADEATYEITMRLQADAVQDGAGEQWLSTPIKLRGRIHAYKGDNWLGLDVGTSTIVAAFGDSLPMGQPPLLPIGSEWSRLYPNAVLGETDHFLPSTLLLQQGKSVTADDFVMLSPPVQLLADYPQHVVPYLKRVIGFERVPISDTFTYVDASGRQVTGRPPMHDVLAALYKTLVGTCVKRLVNEEIRQMVVAVPNTLTPSQRGRLREAIASVMPSGCRIEFLSEPVAVACYYLANWLPLHGAQGEPPDQETILIYDMGAGTLDVTLLRAERVSVSDIIDSDGGEWVNLDTFGLPGQAERRWKLTVLAQSGRFSAGNNLDYAFAGLIQSSIQHDIATTVRNLGQRVRVLADLLDTRGQITNSQVLNRRLSLRDNARHAKHSYADDPTISPQVQIAGAYGNDLASNSQSPVKLTSDDINASDAIAEFLRSNTSSLFDDLFACLGHERGTIVINTVILSGRAVQFPGLRQDVEISITEWAAVERAPEYITLKGESLKSSVALGCLAYATAYRGRRMEIESPITSARYGFMTQEHGCWQYQEVLSAVNAQMNVGAGGQYLTNTTTVHVGNSPFLILVQTFAADPVADWSERGQSLTMPIHRFNSQAFANAQNLQVTITIAEEDVTLNIGGNMYTGLKLQNDDLNQVPGYREGRWPLC